MSDLDVLKEIPGYKAILKSVLKSQIQLLMQQLSEHAGEESIIMTASVHDGTLSHLGSSTGKGFLEGRDEIKSQFLGYCLKTYHKQKTHEPQKPYQRTHPSPRSPAQISLQSSKRPRLHSASPGNTYPPVTSSFPPATGAYLGQSGTDSGNANDLVRVKTEIIDNQSENTQTGTMDTLPHPAAMATIPDTIHLSHTLTTGANTPSTQISSDLHASVSSIESETGQDVNDTEDTDSSNISNIKVEQVEDELEITGVEMAAANWGQGQGQTGFGTDDDSSFSQSANQSGYSELKIQSPSNYKHAVAGPKLDHSSLINGGRNTEIPDNAQVITGPEVSKVIKVFKVSQDKTSVNVSKERTPDIIGLCLYCGKDYCCKVELLKHIKDHEERRPFCCEVCGKSFRQVQHLNHHKYMTHFRM